MQLEGIFTVEVHDMTKCQNCSNCIRDLRSEVATPIAENEKLKAERDELVEAVLWNAEVMIFIGESTKLHDEAEKIFMASSVDITRIAAKIKGEAGE